jgi:DNA-binding XRE family transcriptional regulator
MKKIPLKKTQLIDIDKENINDIFEETKAETNKGDFNYTLDEILREADKETAATEEEKILDEIENVGMTYEQLRTAIYKDIMAEVEKKIKQLTTLIGEKTTEYDETQGEALIIKHKKPVLSPLMIEPGRDYIIKNRLADIIEDRGLKQGRIAAQLGISDKTLSNIVNERFNTSLETAFKLCCLLNLKIDEVFWIEEVSK